MGTKGWFYGDKAFAKSLRIGVYHLKRAKLRLKTMGLIRIEKRGPKLFAYFFQDKLQLWRVTKEVAIKLKIDHEKMGHGQLNFIETPFECKKHFEAYFKQLHPQFTDGRKGRAKEFEPLQIGVEELEPIDPTEHRQSVSPFKKRLAQLSSQHPLKIIASYFNYRDRIEALRIRELHSEDPDEITFLEKLEIAADKAMRLEDEQHQKILQDVHFKLTHGESNLEISRFLDHVHSIVEAKNVGGQNEIPN